MIKNPLPDSYELRIPEIYAGYRLDHALVALFPQHSRSRLQQWIKQAQVLVDDVPRRAKDKLNGGEQIKITMVPEPDLTWSAQALDLSIVFEDEAIMVINKPVGLVVHPAAGNKEHTLANALLHYCPALAKIPRAGIVHRLDKGTSGLLVVAKTLEAHTALVGQLQTHAVQREYYAVVNGVLTAGGTINQKIGRHPVQRQKMAVNVAAGKRAVTHYRVVERFCAHTLLKVFLETGRTHQIRVHMAYAGYPLIGDGTYGTRVKLPPKPAAELIAAIQQFNHQALHARRLSFTHPQRQEMVSFEAALPLDMAQLIILLQENKNTETTKRTF